MFSTSSAFRSVSRALSNISIRGLKLVRAAKGQGTLDDVGGASSPEVLANVVKALEDAETKVSSILVLQILCTKLCHL